MSWECPHQSGAEPYCDRRSQPCKPLSKGCVLYGQVQFVGQDQKDPMKLSGQTKDNPDTTDILFPDSVRPETAMSSGAE